MVYNRRVSQLRESACVSKELDDCRGGRRFAPAVRGRFDAGETFHAFLYEAGRATSGAITVGPARRPRSWVPLGTWTTRRPPAAELPRHAFDREASTGSSSGSRTPPSRSRSSIRFVLACSWRRKGLALERTVENDGREIGSSGAEERRHASRGAPAAGRATARRPERSA